MAFRADELSRIKAELGYNVLTVGADVYVGVTSMFETVVNAHIADLVETTSSTSVSEAGQRTIVLGDATGFAAGQRVVVDVDERLETITAQSLSGTSLTGLFLKLHTGTYPVAVEGPITIAREELSSIARLKTEMRAVMGEGSIKKADEVEFYQIGGGAFSGGDSLFQSLTSQLMHHRDELASALGVPNMWRSKHSGNLRLSVY